MKLPVASLAFIGSPYSKQTKYQYKSAEHRISKAKSQLSYKLFILFETGYKHLFTN